MNGVDLAILAVIFIGSLWVVISVVEDVVHQRRLDREDDEVLAEVHYIDARDDPCVCSHSRQAHYTRRRNHTRGACFTPECPCATYIPERLKEAQ